MIAKQGSAWPDAKDPQDETWWALDCKGFLQGASIISADWTAAGGVAIADKDIDGTVLRIKLTGGNVGTHIFKVFVTASDGQKYDRSVVLTVAER